MPLPSNLVVIVIRYLCLWKSIPGFQKKMKIHQDLILKMIGPNSGRSNVIKWVKTSKNALNPQRAWKSLDIC